MGTGHKNSARTLGLAALAMLVGAGCDDAQITLRMRMIEPPANTTQAASDGTTAVALAGQNGTVGLESLRYAIETVKICQSMTIMGTGFSNPVGCLEIYRGPDAPSLRYDPADDLTGLAAAARADDAPFVDLATAEGRAQITGSREIMSNELGQYAYGIITWYPPIKVQATVTIDGATTLRTHDGDTGSRLVGADGFRQYLTTSPTAFASTATSDPAVVLLPNGGNWFKFQRPLDLEAAAAAPAAGSGTGSGSAVGTGEFIDVDLVFDPSAVITAYSERAADSPRVSLVDATGAGFEIPMLDLAPIVRTQGRDGVREDWLADLGGGASYRLSLYGVTADANREVYGVLSRMMMTGSSVAPMDWFQAPKIAGIEVAADGTFSFSDAEGAAVVRGFARTALAPSAGATVAAEVRCTGHDETPSPHGFFIAGCAAGTWRAVSFVAL